MNRREQLYTRVFSDKQDIDLSKSAQHRALIDYIARNRHNITRDSPIKKAKSSYNAARAAFRDIISLAGMKYPLFKAILCGGFIVLLEVTKTPLSASHFFKAGNSGDFG